jgi:ABC-2 type transport system permease protein
VAITSFGVVVASRITRMESFQVVMQLILLPMLFLSGAMFPLRGLPVWLTVITRLNPLTYAIDPVRSLVFSAQHMSEAARLRFPTGVELFGQVLPLGAELGIVAALAVVFLLLAIPSFTWVE